MLHTHTHKWKIIIGYHKNQIAQEITKKNRKTMTFAKITFDDNNPIIKNDDNSWN